MVTKRIPGRFAAETGSSMVTKRIPGRFAVETGSCLMTAVGPHHMYGYNVNQQDDLTRAERQPIISFAIAWQTSASS